MALSSAWAPRAEATVFFAVGMALLWAACFVHYEKEDPDEDRDD